MDEKDLQDNWPAYREKLLQKYPNLTREELAYEIGQEGELLQRLQKKLGKNWKEIKNMLALLG